MHLQMAVVQAEVELLKQVNATLDQAVKQAKAKEET